MMKEERQLLDEKYGGIESASFEKDRARLARGEPLAYVIGSIPFLGLKIFLDSKPLIPRPETEWWTEAALARISEHASPSPAESRAHSRRHELRRRSFTAPQLPSHAGSESLRNASECGFTQNEFRFLDLCAGSGAIGCAALKILPSMEVFFGEIDPEHEATIRKNIRENGLDEARAHISIGDLFAPFGTTQFDFIAANPPYIPEGRALPESVATYEPALALRAGESGLAIIRRIAKELPHRLNPSGAAWIECDTEHIEEAKALFEKEGLQTAIHLDQYERPRLVEVQLQ